MTQNALTYQRHVFNTYIEFEFANEAEVDCTNEMKSSLEIIKLCKYVLIRLKLRHFKFVL